MKALKQITSQYPSYYAAGKDLNVNAQQLKRLVDKGALVDEVSGVIYIPSQTVIKKAASKRG